MPDGVLLPRQLHNPLNYNILPLKLPHIKDLSIISVQAESRDPKPAVLKIIHLELLGDLSLSWVCEKSVNDESVAGDLLARLAAI